MLQDTLSGLTIGQLFVMDVHRLFRLGIMGAVIFLFLRAVTASGFGAGAKYCESCRRLMSSRDRKRVASIASSTMLLLQQEQYGPAFRFFWEDAYEVVEGALARATEKCGLQLDWCPKCQNGYVSLGLTEKRIGNIGGVTTDHEDRWLIFSRGVSPDDTAQILAVLKRFPS